MKRFLTISIFLKAADVLKLSFYRPKEFRKPLDSQKKFLKAVNLHIEFLKAAEFDYILYHRILH